MVETLVTVITKEGSKKQMYKESVEWFDDKYIFKDRVYFEKRDHDYAVPPVEVESEVESEVEPKLAANEPTDEELHAFLKDKGVAGEHLIKKRETLLKKAVDNGFILNQ